jgi:phenylalanyl-tRNA synthetase alpha chain
MKGVLSELKKEAEAAIKKAASNSQLDRLEFFYFGRKGKITQFLKSIKKVTPKERKQLGSLYNNIKQELLTLLANKKTELGAIEWNKIKDTEWLDTTEPPIFKKRIGHLHPITQVINELEDWFQALGFMILDGPELESDYYNFESLNIPSWHPARDMQDTFYIDNHQTWLMRTHTSVMQVRCMQKFGAPLRVIVPGRVFRHEATDASHEHTFYQLDGFMVDKNISIANLIAVMREVLKGIFKRDVAIRTRPGYFPFVEPGFEMDLSCLSCGGNGCVYCKQTGWLEIVGCGMIHPNVLRYGGLDIKEWSGFAFGFGLTRLVMMRYGIEDIRLLQNADLRFLNQF